MLKKAIFPACAAYRNIISSRAEKYKPDKDKKTADVHLKIHLPKHFVYQSESQPISQNQPCNSPVH